MDLGSPGRALPEQQASASLRFKMSRRIAVAGAPGGKVVISEENRGMAVPDFQAFMLPVMRIMADRKEHSLVELRERLATEMVLTNSDLEEKIPSGTQTKYTNRVYWASVYLSKAGVLKRVRRGVLSVTDRGLELLNENHPKITVKLLSRFPEFTEFHKGSSPDSGAEPNGSPGKSA